MIRLIAFDLDGTLLNQEKKVDPVTKDALNRLAEQGVFSYPCYRTDLRWMPGSAGRAAGDSLCHYL